MYVDSDARRVYISHGTHTVVMDADTYAVVGDIPDTQGVHGIAVASAAENDDDPRASEFLPSMVAEKTPQPSTPQTAPWRARFP